MKYTITRDKLKRVVRSFIGPLENSEYRTSEAKFPSWLNSEGKIFFVLFPNNDVGIDEKLFRSMESLLGLENWSYDDYDLFKKVLAEIVDEIVGVKSDGLLLFDFSI